MNAIIDPAAGPYNLSDYDAARKSSPWERAATDLTWSRTGKLNLAHEAVDRHVEEGYGEKTALIYADEEREFTWTFATLKTRSDQYARLLRGHGIRKGDRVFIFLPKIPELYAGLLGILKAGGVAGPLFEAFYEDALRDRMGDCGARFLITDPELYRRVPRADLPTLEKVFILKEPFPTEDRSGEPALNSLDVPDDTLDLLLEFRKTEEADAGDAGGDSTVWVEGDDGLIIHYTSGSTGKPKGILHAHRAMIQHYLTGKWVLDLRDDDVYWCTAHPGWVTGSSYGVFSPWLNRATILVNGGRFDAATWYGLIERHKVTVWYSAPTAFRMLLAAGDEVRSNFDLSSLRHILSVGEPLNPELVHWGKKAFGTRIHDTWWMTETGAQLVVNLPSEPIKPGSMGRPFPGIEVAILDDAGRPVPPLTTGQLAVKTPWPSLMKAVWNNPGKFDSYFAVAGYYLSGDSAYMDEDGYVFFQGRGDDLITASGEKVSPFEVESTLIEHWAVAEAGVIGKPDPIRGALVKAFVLLRAGVEPTRELGEEIKQFVKTRLSAHAYPKEIEILEELPKTRVSGKIMRRVLKAWETGQDVGDTTTLEGGVRLTRLVV